MKRGYTQRGYTQENITMNNDTFHNITQVEEILKEYFLSFENSKHLLSKFESISLKDLVSIDLLQDVTMLQLENLFTVN